jgi:ubiquinone biosynthesis protein COQ4
MMSTSSKGGLRPLTALSAMLDILRNPDDTKHVFRILDALRGDTDDRILKRLQGSPSGARLLRERVRLLDLLEDHETLGRLPGGSVGRAYLAFLEREQITAAGLVAASIEGRGEGDGSDTSFVGDMMRDQHDLWHVVTGYHGDIAGEAGMLAFTLAQTWHPGIALIVAVAVLKSDADGRAFLREGFRRGREAAWLPEQDWALLLARPLDEVRRELGVGDPPDYEPIRSRDLAPGALLSFRKPEPRVAA